MATLSKDEAIEIAKGKGINLLGDFHGENCGTLMAELAKAAGYKKPKNANGSTGRYFFYHLQKLELKEMRMDDLYF